MDQQNNHAEREALEDVDLEDLELVEDEGDEVKGGQGRGRRRRARIRTRLRLGGISFDLNIGAGPPGPTPCMAIAIPSDDPLDESPEH